MNQSQTDKTQTTECVGPASAAPDGAGRSLGRRIADKFIRGKGIFTFLRSSVSSQIASWTDMGVAFLLFAWVLRPLGADPLRQFVATAVGLVVGGVVNCCINYKFTFRAENCPVKAVAVKYLLIWSGSFILNLCGTTVLTHVLQSVTFLYDLGVKADGIFAFSRLSVSLIVSLAWNFILQKNFVYVPTKFDPFAIRLVDAVTFHNRRHRGKHRSSVSSSTNNSAPDSK